MKSSIARFIKSLATLALFGATHAFAGYTVIKPPPVGEAGHEAIIEHLYGGNFVQSGNHFSNGAITAYRCEDDWRAPGCMPLCGDGANSASDQMWNGYQFTAKAVAKFSMNSQSLGLESGSSYQNMFNVTGYGFNISNSSKTLSAFGDDFCFERTGDSGTQSSKDSDNLDGRDHMITYCIEGLNPGEQTWLMFWEDLNLSEGMSKKRSSSDFNDLVVEITAKPSAVSVPLPPALYSGLSLLLGTGLFKKLRRVH